MFLGLAGAGTRKLNTLILLAICSLATGIESSAERWAVFDPYLRSSISKVRGVYVAEKAASWHDG